MLTHLILDGLITNLQPDQMFKRFKKSFIEVKVNEFWSVLHEWRHDAVNVVDWTFRYVEQWVTWSLKNKQWIALRAQMKVLDWALQSNLVKSG